MKKHLILACAVMGSAVSLFASEVDRPLWLRHSQISPDGQRIAFCYQGDIYTVPTSGGIATRLTTHKAYESNPIWSPSGRQLAFSSNRNGSDNVYIMNSDGGVARQITFSSVGEHPVAFTSESQVLFQANKMPDRRTSLYPSSRFPQLYSVSTEGNRPKLYSSLPMEQISIAQGNILYTDIKGYEDPWRKHHTSAIARDIWQLDKAGKYTKLTSFAGEDRNPIADGQGGFYYLSEQDGTSNVYHRADGSAKDTQLTHFKGNPVRFLSRSQNGILSFGYDGELYTLSPGAEPKRVSVRILSDQQEKPSTLRSLTYGATSVSISPSGKEVALVLAGDVYVANMEYGTTKRITNTAEEERDVDFAPDGRSIVYASERNGCWNIYQASLGRKDEDQFAYAREIVEKPLTKGVVHSSFSPQYSPSGKEIAFLRNRSAIYVLDLASGKERMVMPQRYNYSYTDGDQSFEWSPDGKWILTDYIGIGGWNHKDCAIFASDGSGKMLNLTESGYNDIQGSWVLGGKAFLFSSDRSGYRSHGSWGAMNDLYIMFLDQDEYERFYLSKEDRNLLKIEQEKQKKEKAKKDKDAKDSSKDSTKKSDKKAQEGKADTKANETKKEEAVPLEFEGREERLVRLTRVSGSVGGAVMNREGTKIYYLARYEQDYDLWEYNVEDKSNRVIIPRIGGGSLIWGKDNTLYLNGRYGLKKIVGSSATPINYAVEQEYKPAAERAYIFEHTWALVREKFYDANIHGVDWKSYKKTYQKFLPYITEGQDFAEMLSEMLGELNASHTGARYNSRYRAERPTGALGAFFDLNYQGDGLKIEEILINSPLSKAKDKLKPGMIIQAIDGETIKADTPLEHYLNGKVGKRVILSVDGREVEVRPISYGQQQELLFERWLRQREELVRQWSNGRIGYVYVRKMDSPSFRSVFKDLLGKYRNCDAVVVDTRHNGGGWLHEDLAVLLSGKEYLQFTPRGQYIGSDPFMQWNKPSCVLMNEGNYSNGHGFPWVYKHLKLGKLIGTPMAGTMTAVWWETQIDGATTIGVPQVTCTTPDGKALENLNLVPDIEVYNWPADYNNGDDPQLKRAVEEMLQEAKAFRSPFPTH